MDRVKESLPESQIVHLLFGFIGCVCGFIGGAALGFAGVAWPDSAIASSILPALAVLIVLLVVFLGRMAASMAFYLYVISGCFIGWALSFFLSFSSASFLRWALINFIIRS